MLAFFTIPLIAHHQFLYIFLRKIFTNSRSLTTENGAHSANGQTVLSVILKLFLVFTNSGFGFDISIVAGVEGGGDM